LIALVALVVAAFVGRTLLRRSRRGEVALLAGRVSRRAAVNRARSVFASAERREALDAELQLHTAEEVARTLGEMKGVMMKMGQLASFLYDGMPEPARAALEQLQQSAPPMSPELSAQMIETELGLAPDKLFAEWDEVPIAAASIGQVHRAITHDGVAVAVKVQYPDVADAIREDLGNVDIGAMVLPLMFKNLDAKAVGEEIKARITEELDYELEARNQAQFARWYRGHPFIHVPDVVPELSTARVLTTELAGGARFQEMEMWSQDERNLAGEAIYRFVFRSLYQFHAFNGDPHPGNYLFEPGGRVTFLDFGLVRHYDAADIVSALRIADAAVVNPDRTRLLEATVAAGYFDADVPVDDDRWWEYARMFWEPIIERGVHPITPEWATELVQNYTLGTLSKFGDVAKHAKVPAQWVILQRINLGVFAILGRLRAEADWRGAVEEIWPMTQAPPATALGELEADWLRSVHALAG
jgi:predicted unusual protein kinase regulating ubiquinone biosynthesis (AarF/ABC1/UbiB family)